MMRRELHALLGLLAIVTSGCTRTTPPHWQPGGKLVVVSHEKVPGGIVASRDHYVLKELNGEYGVFERSNRNALHVPLTLRFDHPSPAGERPEQIVTPAGRFPCVRTHRTRTLRTGPVMRIDEWWSPGVPIPVQTFERWQGLPQRLLVHAPARAESLLVGMRWSRLESIEPSAQR